MQALVMSHSSFLFIFYKISGEVSRWIEIQSCLFGPWLEFDALSVATVIHSVLPRPENFYV
jgi:hypothetical protein